MIRIRRKEYRKKKLKWLEGLNRIHKENMLQNRDHQDVLLTLRLKEFKLYKERNRLDMELGRVRLIRDQMMFAVDNIKAEMKSEKEEDEKEEDEKEETKKE